MSKQITVHLNDTNEKQLKHLMENSKFNSQSEVIRHGIDKIYQNETGDYQNTKVDDTDNNSDTPDNLVQKEKQKLEKKEAKTKAKHEQLKDNQSDLLDQLDSHKFTVDNADNLMVKWLHYEKRGDNVASWKETHSVEHLNDDLHGMDQYRPSKEKVLETLKNGGDLIQHSEHDEVDAEPQEIKAVKP